MLNALTKPLFALATSLVMAGLLASPAFAAPSVVKVTLLDQGANMTMGTEFGLTGTGNAANATMKIIAVPAFARAGEVTFNVTNNSKDTIHEMVVLKIDDKTVEPPYIPAESKVDEDAAGSLGEVSELDPGQAGSVTLKLDPGTYMLVCNIPGHYLAGMWTLLTVK